MKQCSQCKEWKNESEFYIRKNRPSGFRPDCKICVLLRQKKYRQNSPWMESLHHIKQRCENPNNWNYQFYGGKDIKCLITEDEIKFLWFRDKAYLMKKPHISRLDHTKNYTLDNCLFQEKKDNVGERNTRILKGKKRRN